MRSRLEKAYKDVKESRDIILNEVNNLEGRSSNSYANYFQELMIMSGIMVLCYSSQLKYLTIEEDGYGETEKSNLRIELMDELIKVSALLADNEMLRRKYIEHFTDLEIEYYNEINVSNILHSFNEYIDDSMLMWSN